MVLEQDTGHMVAPDMPRPDARYRAEEEDRVCSLELEGRAGGLRNRV